MPTQSRIGTVVEGAPVVGIGASAGGLDALSSLFAGIPVESGLAFVVIQHLDPTHESILADLLQHHTTMPVEVVRDGLQVQPNHVYVIPPGKDLTLNADGRLQLHVPDVDARVHLPIDRFFRSLAEARGESAVGVVLSGSGSDGTLGLRALREAGGIALVQDPDTAEHASMPQSAIDGGQADWVLPLTAIGQALSGGLDIRRRLVTAVGDDQHAEYDRYSASMKRVFGLLRQHAGHDFSGYKKNTLLRRIERRMLLAHCQDIDDYLGLLQSDAGELDSLFQDLLIGVTGFFRDSAAFDCLDQRVIDPLLGNSVQGPNSIRMWVPACATGEEAYSLAILLDECCRRRRVKPHIQIFATDIDQAAVDKARTGLYPATIASEVSTERLHHFFTKIEDHDAYRVKPWLRDRVVFAAHSLLRDPPFSKLDLISCRNFLIYLDNETQQRILSLFHYALNPGGYLFLGNSETLGAAQPLFSSLDQKWKIFQRAASSASLTRVLTMASDRHSVAPASLAAPRFPRVAPDDDFKQFIEHHILRQLAPTCILCNSAGEMLYVHGRTGKYFEQSTGATTFSLMKMARPDLRLPLTSALRKASRTRTSQQCDNIAVATDGDVKHVRLQIDPVDRPESLRGLLLVTLTETSEPTPLEHDEAESGDYSQDQRVAALEHELRATREYLQTTIEEQETTNEELRSANEELQSSNEEMQSTNEELQTSKEELQTSKEELQSANEELATLNTELSHRIIELTEANDDIRNLLEQTRTGIIFLDRELCIRRFTDAVRPIVELIPADLGRPVSRFVTRLPDVDLELIAAQVLESGEPLEREVRLEGDAVGWYLLQVMPYLTAKQELDGIVISFTDIRSVKKAEAERLAARNELEKSQQIQRELFEAIEQSAFAYDVVDETGLFMYANPAYLEMWGYSDASEVIGTSPASHCADPETPLHIIGTVKEFGGGDFEFKARRKDGSTFDCWMKVTSFRRADGTEFFHGFSQDISERKQAEQSMRTSERLLREAQRTAHIAHWTFDLQSGVRWWSDELYRIYGLDPEHGPLSFEEYSTLVHPDDWDRFDATVMRTIASGEPYDIVLRIRRPDRQERIINTICKPVTDENGQVIELRGTIQDVTRLSQIESKLRDSELRYRSLFENMAQGAFYQSADGSLIDCNPALLDLFGLTRDEFLGRTSMHPEWRVVDDNGNELPGERHPSMRALRLGEPVLGEAVGVFNPRRRDYVWLIVNAIPQFREGSEQPWQVFVTLQDITERKRLDTELQAHRDHLKALVESRTADLAEATRQAQSSNRAKSAFLANMSHEIRTPLNTILGAAYLLEKAQDNSDLAPRVAAIRKAGLHLQELIDDVLDLSRVEAGRLELQLKPFDPATIGANVISILTQSASDKGLQLSLDNVALPSVLRGDATRLTQSLLNLANNAVKFTLRGFVTVGVAVESEDESTVTLRFQVSDSGPGIEENQIPRLFRMFQQADDSTTRRHGGSGLGLAITRRLAELMNGEAGADSVPGAGSTFWFTACLEKCDEELPPVVSTPGSHAAEQLAKDCAGMTVMVVEDDPANQMIARELLENVGLSVVLSPNGRDAIRRVSDGEPMDAILLDLQMPELNGVEAARRIRSLPSGQAIPILALTANAFDSDRARCEAAGMNGFVSKPVDPDQLYDCLLAWLPSRTAESGGFPGKALIVDDEPMVSDFFAEILRIEGLDVVVSSDGRDALDLLSSPEHHFDLLITDQSMPGLLGTELIAEAKRRTPAIKAILCSGHVAQSDTVVEASQAVDIRLMKPVSGKALAEAVRQALRKST